jgi:hypothetical protein
VATWMKTDLGAVNLDYVTHVIVKPKHLDAFIVGQTQPVLVSGEHETTLRATLAKAGAELAPPRSKRVEGQGRKQLP